ncbi:MAG: hypothetical protein EZS28_031108 [Streblomastix strix]|uniref:Uncharacterized protein n=1 Tax=Streblomastix strix TaxID=222440 RepID=A0A5J4URR5_9EUKA|nr:MAG: hypothetical protein EZS28_031108 [Streblomastix strix]
MQVGKQIKIYEDGYKGPNVLKQAQQNKLLAIRTTPVKDSRLWYETDDDVNSDEQDDEEIISEKQPVKEVKKSSQVSKQYKDPHYILLPNYANLVPQNPLQLAAQPQPTNTRRGADERDSSSTGALGWTFRTRNVANRFLRGKTVRRASGRSKTTHKCGHRLDDEKKAAETQQSISTTNARFGPSFRRSGIEIAATVQIATGNTDIDRKTILDNNTEIQFMHIHKHIRHDLQGKHDASADRHDRTREPTEDSTVSSNTLSIQQLNAEVAMSIVPDRGSTSGFNRYIINENCRFYR